ncbi:hypothetical protein [Anaplasma phagocytophilum]|uniref:Uncharacterized protein n=1 Tax=Anaplasma phagocytophilum TaxID=948 RepID=A0A098EF85_ANAPH|nr:hypothetical protein [Anaplasma phagocytophilum]CEG20959.1 Uncharacterized protein ANAPHAGO_00466 [Anaplasma phagocytophilum]SBO32668.1 hypothetical protein ANAPC4_00888 [Anaplasma phagocytophilum]SBO33061.1 hypothetical protein ANAPC2_01238 [Anaplasma phagocytophilum]SBO33493.1 hypothetical protein ANAPC3_01246 [Anaplasma phagocytophilum]SCV65458.1 hypothetical protein ANAPC5_01156 [Anaplasma phagocytophilum]
MPIFRLMMLSYVLLNFDKICAKIFYVAIYTYIVSISLVLCHEGVASLVYSKNPLYLYPRVYQILKWYYFNKDLITTGMVIRAMMILFCTHITQSYIWGLQWRSLPKVIFSYLSKIFSFKGSSVSKQNRIVFPAEIEHEKYLFISRVEECTEELIVDLLNYHVSEITSDDLINLKKVCAIKIGYAMEDMIRNLVKIKAQTSDTKPKD